MAKPVSNVTIATDTFAGWVGKTNILLDALTNLTVTVETSTLGANVYGNGSVFGTLSANVLSATVMRGGGVGNTANVSTLTIGIANSTVSSNVIITGYTANVTANSLNVTSNSNFSGNTLVYSNTTGNVSVTATNTAIGGGSFDVSSNTNIRSRLMYVYANTTISGANTIIIAGSGQASQTFDANAAVETVNNSIAITTAPTYSINEPVVYTVAAGNTALTGLASGTTYYIQFSNATSVKLSTTPGGTALTLTKGLTQTGHSFAGISGNVAIGASNTTIRGINLNIQSNVSITSANLNYTNATGNVYVNTAIAYITGGDVSITSNTYINTTNTTVNTANFLLSGGQANVTSNVNITSANLIYNNASGNIAVTAANTTVAGGNVNISSNVSITGANLSYVNASGNVSINTAAVYVRGSTLRVFSNSISSGANTIIIAGSGQATQTFDANAAVETVNNSIAITTAPTYSINDPLVYTVAAGNTALTGLASGTTYYIQFSNATSVKLASIPGGSALTLTKGLTQTGHSFAGVSGNVVIGSSNTTIRGIDLNIQSNVNITSANLIYNNTSGNASITSANTTVAGGNVNISSNVSITSANLNYTNATGNVYVNTAIAYITGGNVNISSNVSITGANLSYVSASGNVNINTAAVYVRGGTLRVFSNSVTSGANTIIIAGSGQALATFNSNTDVDNTTGLITIGATAASYTVNDPLVYTVAAGNTALAGLTSGSTFYIQSTTSTAIKLSAIPGGAAISLIKGVTESGHSFTGVSGNVVIGSSNTTIRGINLNIQSNVSITSANLNYTNASGNVYVNTAIAYITGGNVNISSNVSTTGANLSFVNASGNIAVTAANTTVAGGDFNISSNISATGVTLIYNNVSGNVSITSANTTVAGGVLNVTSNTNLRPAQVIVYANTVMSGANVDIIAGSGQASQTFDANAAVETVNNSIAITTAPKYSINEPLVYTVAAGNTALAGLASGTTYYIQFSNATSVKLSTTPGGAALALTKGLTQTGHSFAGVSGNVSIGSANTTINGTTFNVQANVNITGANVIINNSSGNVIITSANTKFAGGDLYSTSNVNFAGVKVTSSANIDITATLVTFNNVSGNLAITASNTTITGGAINLGSNVSSNAAAITTTGNVTANAFAATVVRGGGIDTYGVLAVGLANSTVSSNVTINGNTTTIRSTTVLIDPTTVLTVNNGITANGNITLANTVSFGTISIITAKTAAAQTFATATVQNEIDAFTIANFSAAKYSISAVHDGNSNNKIMTEISVVYGHTNAHMTEYGTIFSNTQYSTFYVESNTTHVKLLANSTLTPVTYKMVRTALT